MLPPISDPTPKTEHPDIIIPASPPELPPTPLFLFQGLIERPHKRLPVYIPIQNWGMFVCTNGIIPEFRKHFTKGDY